MGLVKWGSSRERSDIMSLLLRGVIRNGRVEVGEPIDLPEGTEVVVTPEANGRDDGPVPPEEIARVLAGMRQLQPLDIPADVGADLDAWEHGIEDVFR
jgi:hypothetical protein